MAAENTHRISEASPFSNDARPDAAGALAYKPDVEVVMADPQQGQKVKRPRIRRMAVGMVFLAACVGIVFYGGVGTVSSFGWETISAICPLGALEAMLAARTLIPRAVIYFIVVAVALAVLGKFFCAWVCPVPSVRSLIDAITSRRPFIVREHAATAGCAGNASDAAPDESSDAFARRLRVVKPLSWREKRLLKSRGACGGLDASKGATGARAHTELENGVCKTGVSGEDACESAGWSVPATPQSLASEAASKASATAFHSAQPSCVACAVCTPAHARFRFDSRHAVLGGALASSLVFGFPVFCLICPIGLTFGTVVAIAQLFGLQMLSWGLLVFPLMLVLELTVLRKWCVRFCPMGAVASLLSSPNRLWRPRVDNQKCLRAKGVDCQVCSGVCPEELDPHFATGMHECSKCRACVENCPAGAISVPFLGGAI